MKSGILYIIMTVVVLVVSCSNDESKDAASSKITMSTNKSVVHISAAGSGYITIDWGDKTVETHMLKGFVDFEYWNNHSFDEYRYSHNYSDASPRIITITSHNITHIDCYNNQLTSLNINSPMLTYLSCYANNLTNLDVSNAVNLTELICGYNQLTTLDVSINAKLRELACYQNQLTHLNINNNEALEFLNCKGNKLINLDVSNNTAIYLISCQENNLTSQALNDLFSTLHNNTLENPKMIAIRDNPGTDSFTYGTVINGWLIDIFL